MKKFILALVALFTITVSANAMSYDQAREQALFLTDKMAYELNLTDEQYEAAYEINLDYLMSINDYSDLYGTYWRQRNLDLSYILLDWQYRTYVDASYFYRPLYWNGGYWHFGIYARYPHRNYFYFGCPNFYTVYRGGHSWRTNGGRSWYCERSWDGPHRGQRIGMRDNFKNGNYGRGWSNRNNNNNRVFGNMQNHNNNNNRVFGNSQSRSNTGGFSNSQNRSNNGNRVFGQSNRQNNINSFGSSSRVFGQSNRQSSTRSTVGSSNGESRVFGGSRNFNSTPSRSFSPRNGSSSTPSRSFGNSNSSTRSFGNNNGESRSSGGSFGGHR